MKVSGVIIAKNEEGNIGSCIKSIDFCDEIIVIDDNSEDKTKKIAEELGARVIIHSLEDNYSNQRNFGLKEAKNDWVLFLDADEVVSKELKEEIIKLDDTNSVNGYYLVRSDIFFGKEIKHGESGNTKLLRLGNRVKGEWKRDVHETWEIKGKVKTLKGKIIHTKSNNLRELISKLDYYSTIHAKENYDEGKKSSVFKIIFFPVFKFIYNYFFKLGFLDGTEGVVIAFLMSLHSFLAWSKLWLKQKHLLSVNY